MQKGTVVSMTLAQALNRIKELEKENSELRAIIKDYEKRDPGGRRKHDAHWQASYNTFVKLYEQGYTMSQIVDRASFSKRTAYRYKAYYVTLNPDKNRVEKRGRRAKKR